MDVRWDPRQMAVTIRSWADRELATIANKDDPVLLRRHDFNTPRCRGRTLLKRFRNKDKWYPNSSRMVHPRHVRQLPPGFRTRLRIPGLGPSWGPNPIDRPRRYLRWSIPSDPGVKRLVYLWQLFCGHGRYRSLGDTRHALEIPSGWVGRMMIMRRNLRLLQ